MLTVGPGMISRNMNLWNLEKDRQATRKETKELIESKDLYIKYLHKHGGIAVGLTKKASKIFRLFDVGVNPHNEHLYNQPTVTFERVPEQFEVTET